MFFFTASVDVDLCFVCVDDALSSQQCTLSSLIWAVSAELAKQLLYEDVCCFYRNPVYPSVNTVALLKGRWSNDASVSFSRDTVLSFLTVCLCPRWNKGIGQRSEGRMRMHRGWCEWTDLHTASPAGLLAVNISLKATRFSHKPDLLDLLQPLCSSLCECN